MTSSAKLHITWTRFQLNMARELVRMAQLDWWNFYSTSGHAQLPHLSVAQNNTEVNGCSFHILFFQ